MTQMLSDTHELTALSAVIRRQCLESGHAAGPGGAHFGPALSLVEIMAVLYGRILRVDPSTCFTPERDRLILSKGHGSLALYSALHAKGFIPEDVMATCESDGSRLPGQPIRDRHLGVEYSSGSLGMGLSYGLGIALSARLKSQPTHVYVVMGDGETNEGSVWEAAMAASHLALGNLTAIVDCNSLQSDGETAAILSMNHAALWKAAGWLVIEVPDGHSIPALLHAFEQHEVDRPRVILATTVKGRGISFMEGDPNWHHGALTSAQADLARSELDSHSDPAL